MNELLEAFGINFRQAVLDADPSDFELHQEGGLTYETVDTIVALAAGVVGSLPVQTWCPIPTPAATICQLWNGLLVSDLRSFKSDEEARAFEAAFGATHYYPVPPAPGHPAAEV